MSVVRPRRQIRRSVVTGGAGFIGSRLCEVLLDRGRDVICVDSLERGRMENIAHLLERDEFSFARRDVRYGIDTSVPVDEVFHLASIVGPEFCEARPDLTLEVAFEGTRRALDFAMRHEARFLLTSSSEIYGEPYVWPTPEWYGGNLNPVGPRGPYAEGKRVAETMVAIASAGSRVDGKIVRLFNTFGPRMRPDDGRIVPTFLRQALAGEPLTVNRQNSSRSYAFVDDIVEGMLLVMEKADVWPVNLGHADSFSSTQVAELVLELTGSESTIELVEHSRAYAGEPKRRAPDLTRAHSLGWYPTKTLERGLELTLDAIREEVAA